MRTGKYGMVLALGWMLSILAGSASCVLDSKTFTPPPPTAPRPRLPRNDVYQGSALFGALRPQFVWEPSTTTSSKGAISYELQYSSDQTFGHDVTTVQTDVASFLPDASLPVSTSPPVGRRYYWRVRGCQLGACSDYSPTWWVNLGRSDKDFNGDGYADVAVGAQTSDLAGIGAGAVYVYFGGSGPSFDTVPDGVLAGAMPGSTFGASVASAGDFNADGYADLLVGASADLATSRTYGRAYLYFGGPGTSFKPTPDFSFSAGVVEDEFGQSVSSAGDVNGDGFSDIVIGAPYTRATGSVAGQAYVYFGGTPAPLVKAQGILTGEAAGERWLGALVSTAGDINGDGFSDIAVASLNRTCLTRVYLGEPGEKFDSSGDLLLEKDPLTTKCLLRTISNGDLNEDGFSDLISEQNDGITSHMYVTLGSSDLNAKTDLDFSLNLTWKFSSSGDVNGDGTPDLVAIEKRGTQNRATVHAGIRGGVGYLDASVFADDFDPNEHASIAFAGDVNGDGFGDVVVGSSPPGGTGKAYVYFGNAGTAIDPDADAILTGPSNSSFGWSVASATGPVRHPTAGHEPDRTSTHARALPYHRIPARRR